MTGYTVHTGSNKKFIAGWDQIFQGTISTKKSAAGKATKKTVTPKVSGEVKSKQKTSVKKKARKSSRRSSQ